MDWRLSQGREKERDREGGEFTERSNTVGAIQLRRSRNVKQIRRGKTQNEREGEKKCARKGEGDCSSIGGASGPTGFTSYDSSSTEKYRADPNGRSSLATSETAARKRCCRAPDAAPRLC